MFTKFTLCAFFFWGDVKLNQSRYRQVSPFFFRVNPEHQQLTSSAHPTRTHRKKVSLMSAVWITSSSFLTLCTSVISSSSVLNGSLFAAAPNQSRLPWISTAQQRAWRKLDCWLTTANCLKSVSLKLFTPCATSKYIRSSKHHHCDRRWFKCTFLRHLLLTLAVSRRHECFRCC